MRNQDSQFYNKAGDLTKYSFVCGYIQRKESRERWKEIYMEHRHFHVRTGPIGAKVETWETFDYEEMTKAKRLYQTIKI